MPFVDPEMVKSKEVVIETYIDDNGMERTRKKMYIRLHRVKPLPPKPIKLPKFIPLFGDI